MNSWRMQREVHYDNRLMKCFVGRPRSVIAMFRATVRRLPDQVALVAGEERLTYHQLDIRVSRMASHLSAIGFRAGERIGILLGNCPEFAVTVLASAYIGLIAVPMNIRQRRPEIAYMLSHCAAACLVVTTSLASEIPDSDEIPSIRQIFEVGGSLIPMARSFDALGRDVQPVEEFEADEEDPFCILYTSGTTGKPKGAVLTHLGVVHSVIHYEIAFGLVEADIALLAVPASHVTGLVAILLTSFHIGGTAILLEAFKARAFLDVAERERVSYTLMVPTMYNLILLDPSIEQYDLGCWRIGGFGGAPMPTTTIERVTQYLPSLALANIYGATETTSPATVLVPGQVSKHADSVGVALPCADIIVCDESGAELDDGQSGEIWIGGPMTIPRYWDDPTADKVSFVRGFWRSGDIGTVDADGYLRVLDRKKDVINRGGYKIYCIEVENVIASYPGIRECAIVGRPDEILGERSHAFVFASGMSVDIGVLRDYCANCLSDYKVPDFITILDVPLPRNANGKIAKRDLKNQAIV